MLLGIIGYLQSLILDFRKGFLGFLFISPVFVGLEENIEIFKIELSFYLQFLENLVVENKFKLTWCNVFLLISPLIFLVNVFDVSALLIPFSNF